MLVRKRLDISWSWWARAGLSCLAANRRDADRAVAAIEKAFGEETHAWPCLSVRSGFDATLRALNFPRGSEVLVTAVTIPGMPRILEEHGLVPVPVEIEPETGALSCASAERALTDRTKALVAASLFGTRQDLEALAAWSRERGLLYFADEAQAFDGAEAYRRSAADVTLLSFGPIKTCTALGGGVLLFRDRELKETVDAVASRYSQQSDREFLARVLRFGAVKALGYGPIADAAATILRMTGRDPDEVAATIAQSFPGDDFFDRIRKRPAPALLRTLADRLRTFDRRRVAARAAAGRRLRERLGPDFVVPGSSARTMTYWTFPVLVDDPRATAARLREKGLDATARSSLVVVPASRPDDEETVARVRSWFDRMIFLPFDIRYSARTLDRSADEFLRVARPFRPEPAESTRPSAMVSPIAAS